MIAIWLGVMVLAAALLSWVELVHRMVAPRIEAEVIPVATSLAFQAVTEITIIIRNPTWLPCPLLRCALDLPDGLSVELDQDPQASSKSIQPTMGKRRWTADRPPIVVTLALRPREVVTVRFDVRGIRRGAHRLQRMMLTVTDGLTMRRQERVFSVARTITVHPRRTAGKRRRVPLDGLGLTASPLKFAPTSCDWVDMREYRAGDDLRDVAWMVTARRGEMIVVERATAMRQVVVVVASVRISELRWEGRADHADRIYEASYALIEALSRQGVQVWVYADGYWGEGLHKASRHVVVRGEGVWTPRMGHDVGHKLGGLAAYAAISLEDLLAEVEREVEFPAVIVWLAGYRDAAVDKKFREWRRRGCRVDSVELSPLAAGDGEGGD